MFKAKNILVIFFINYAIIVVVSAFAELWFVADKAQEVQVLVSTAADMALEQTQATDDFFIKNRGYYIKGNDLYTLKMQKGSFFQDVPMYEGIYGIMSSEIEGKEKIFLKLYNTSDFKSFASKLGNMRMSIGFWNNTHDGFAWYKIPTVSQVGLNVTGINNNTASVTNAGGVSISESLAMELFSNYHYDTHKRIGYNESGQVDYYVTPISTGITYLNEDVLNTLFINNMDLLMRAKYSKEGWDLNTEKGGNGVLKGETYSSLITDSGVSAFNPINNGSFTFIRGPIRAVYNGVTTYKGVVPKIRYKVIDMYDSSNDNILVMLFGANKTAKNDLGVVTGVFSSKADYLKFLDKDILDPATGLPYDEKLIVVAEVTFYADILVPYSTMVMREFRGTMDGGTNNYLDIKHKSTGVVGATGNDCFSYTTYFAVTP